ncbi:MAG TPA: GAP family protein [Gaiellaceae bacterium]|jgi:threonine/homoserine/homoserine lactone efflux protein|nr:GAP family protein [Gaiellaceae bacterium]
MGQAIGEFLPAALGVAISPLPIVAVVLMLVTPRGRVNGPLFVLGWLVGLALVGVLVLSISNGADATGSSGPATWVDWLFLVLGLGLIGLAFKGWQGRPREGEEPATPKWMGALDHFTPVKSAGAGTVLSALNPKNLLLAVAAGAAIADAGVSTGHEIASYVVFALIASLGVATPLAVYFVMGERSTEILQRMKTWLGHNNAVIMAVLLLVIGVKLVGNAISGFSG